MKLSLVPIAAVTIGGIAALAVVAVPAAALGAMINQAAIGDLFPFAIPPAFGARHLMLAVAGGGLGSGAAWIAGGLLFRRADATIADLPAGALHEDMLPVVRRADAHPDAAPRRPLLATRDLATSDGMMEVPAMDMERALPADLDQPLAAYDPKAIPDKPLAPPVARRRTAGTGARSAKETVQPGGGDRLVRPETDATVHALLERLERGVVRRDQAAPARPRGRGQAERGLDDALATLRSLARQA